MRYKLTKLSKHYTTALQKHLARPPNTALGSARKIGHRAVAIGLETLDMVRIHERALAAVEAASSRDGVVERAGLFFAEAITPIEELHRAAIETNRRMSHLNKALAHRTAELASSNRSLKQGVARRKTVERAVQKSRDNFKRLLKQSHRLQAHLRHLVRRVLVVQESGRAKISCGLQDRIAQTLLAINTRLVNVDKTADLNDRGFQKEIASTQRLVDKSVREIKLFVREFGPHQT